MKRNKANERAIKRYAQLKKQLNAVAMAEKQPKQNARDWFRCPAYQAHPYRGVVSPDKEKKHCSVLEYLEKDTTSTIVRV